jgi:hypothetical protein
MQELESAWVCSAERLGEMEAVLVVVVGLSSEENQTVLYVAVVEHPFCGPALPARKLHVQPNGCVSKREPAT